MKSMDVTRRHEYEIDPNSTFSKLKRLQKNLKEEISYKDIHNKNKELIYKKINTKCYEYYKAKISIKEIYDKSKNKPVYSFQNKSEPEKNEPEPEIKDTVRYKVIENSPAELPQCHDPLNKLVLMLREDNNLMLKFIDVIDPIYYEQLCDFLCHFFYTNIFNPRNQTDNLLTLIYLLLEKTVDSFDTENEAELFFSENKGDNSSSNYFKFICKFFKCLCKDNDIRNYLRDIIGDLSLDIFNFQNNESYDVFCSLNIDEINKFVKDNFSQMKNKKKNNDLGINNLLLENINPCILNSYQNKNESEMLNFFEEDYYNSSISDSKEQLKTDNDSNNGNKLLTNFLSNTGLFNLSEQQKSSLEKSKKETNFDINNSSYSRMKENYFSNKNDNYSYNTQIDGNFIVNLLTKNLKDSTDDNYKLFLNSQLNIINSSPNKDIFTSKKIISELEKYKGDSNYDKILLVYKYSLESLKFYLDELLVKIIENKEHFPYILKCICKIVYLLLSNKFPDLTDESKQEYVSEFFFNYFIFPILFDPSYNSIFFKNIYDLDEKQTTDTNTSEEQNSIKKTNNAVYSKEILNSFKFILIKLIKGQLFNSDSKEECNFTIMNNYIIEAIPYFYKITSSLYDIKVPLFIEKFINDKSLPERNINYKIFKDKPNENIEHISYCFSYEDILMLYRTFKVNENIFFPDKNDYLYKTYYKLSFHENTIKKKMEQDKKKSIKAFLFFTKMNYSEEFDEKINAKKKKISFQTNKEMKETENEFFILERVKFCINTIITNLNPLTRANFEESDSTADFVKGLNQMLLLEGFSEMLKEKTIPLEWYGLYLTANIENIPHSRKRNNYDLLYKELEEESIENLKDIKKDESLNEIIYKTKISDKLISIEKNNLVRLDYFRKKFLVNLLENFSLLPTCLFVMYKKDAVLSICIHNLENCFEKKKEKYKNIKYDKKKSIHTHCLDIDEFIANFPILNGKEKDNELIEQLKSISLDLSLISYFDLLSEELSVNENLYVYEEDELVNIKKEIANIIHRRLYSRIFPKKESFKDIQIQKQLDSLAWIEIKNFNPSFEKMNIDLLSVAVDYLNKIDLEICPFDKLRMLSKAIDVVENTFKFNDVEVRNRFSDEKFLNLFLYTFILAKPKKICTNITYIDFLLIPEQKNENAIKMLAFMDKVMIIIMNFSYENLVDVTQEMFEEKMKDVVLNRKLTI